MGALGEQGGTYNYHGNENLTQHELFMLISAECLADHTGISVETAATILAGQPIIPKRKVLGLQARVQA